MKNLFIRLINTIYRNIVVKSRTRFNASLYLMHQYADRNAFVTLFKVQDSSRVFAYHVRIIGDK